MRADAWPAACGERLAALIVGVFRSVDDKQRGACVAAWPGRKGLSLECSPESFLWMTADAELIDC